MGMVCARAWWRDLGVVEAVSGDSKEQVVECVLKGVARWRGAVSERGEEHVVERVSRVEGWWTDEEGCTEDGARAFVYEYHSSRVTWKKKGAIHRDGDKPAVVGSNGWKEWYMHGKRHRGGDKPAWVASERATWWVNGKRHRERDKPAVCTNWVEEWWVNGKRHRGGDKPAIVWADGEKQWWVNGERHRDLGNPAVECPSSGKKEWWVNGNLKSRTWDFKMVTSN